MQKRKASLFDGNLHRLNYYIYNWQLNVLWLHNNISHHSVSVFKGTPSSASKKPAVSMWSAAKAKIEDWGATPRHDATYLCPPIHKKFFPLVWNLACIDRGWWVMHTVITIILCMRPDPGQCHETLKVWNSSVFTVRRYALHGPSYRNSVRPSVYHTRGLCPHGSTYDHDFFTVW